MHHFEYRSARSCPDQDSAEEATAELWCEDVRLADVAASVGTPAYVYSSATLERHFRVFRDAFSPRRPLIAYAVKANSSLSVIATLARLGAGADTVSEGEIRRALAAGIPAERIVFSGVGKTDDELAYSLDAGVAEINVESSAELERLAGVARVKGVRPRVAIRVNPDVGAGGHAKITTGQGGSKFGVSLSEAESLYRRAAARTELELVGVACHIGSQIADLAPLQSAFITMRALVVRLREQGLSVQRLDLGGGLGAPYHDRPDPPEPAAFAAMVQAVIGDLDIELAFEPGRVIVANAGVLLSRVIQVNARADGRRFLVLDAGMNDLLRPAMYDAHHEVWPVRRPQADEPTLAYDVVGPVCESSDVFGRDRGLPQLEAGDLVAFMTAGAYGATMASEYNARPLVPEVLVRGNEYAVTRPRPSHAEMLARDTLAPWL